MKNINRKEKLYFGLLIALYVFVNFDIVISSYNPLISLLTRLSRIICALILGGLIGGIKKFNESFDFSEIISDSTFLSLFFSYNIS